MMEEAVTGQNESTENPQEFRDEGDAIDNAIEKFRANGEYLDIGELQLSSFPEHIYSYCKNLKFLYLEGNRLETLPESFFFSLPQLRWLDVRNNLLKELPSNVAFHNCLEVLLLHNNRLRELPYELSLVPKLRGLQLTDNPLQDPPADVVKNGVQAILEYLRKQLSLILRSSACTWRVKGYVNDTKKGGGPKSKSKSRPSATVVGRRRTSVPRPKPKSADLSAIAVRGYRCNGELLAPGTTPVLTQDRESPDFKTDEKFQHLNHFRSVEEKIFHLCPSAGLIKNDEMQHRVQEQYLKQACVNQLKEMLQRQTSVLQRRSDAAVLKSWRKGAKYSTKLHTKKSGVAPPYGTDPSYTCMLSHFEARDCAFRQQTRVVPSKVSRNLDEEMEDLLIKLNEPSVTSIMSPCTKQRTLQDEINKLTELQCRLQALKLRNSQGNMPATAVRKQ